MGLPPAITIYNMYKTSESSQLMSFFSSSVALSLRFESNSIFMRRILLHTFYLYRSPKNILAVRIFIILYTFFSLSCPCCCFSSSCVGMSVSFFSRVIAECVCSLNLHRALLVACSLSAWKSFEMGTYERVRLYIKMLLPLALYMMCG